jgi:hypothetical protein
VPARGTSRRFPTVSNWRSVQFRRFGVLRILAQTIRHGQESRPKYFSMGENLDHAQNMEANSSPNFWTNFRRRSKQSPISHTLGYGVWTGIFVAGGDALINQSSKLENFSYIYIIMPFIAARDVFCLVVLDTSKWEGMPRAQSIRLIRCLNIRIRLTEGGSICRMTQLSAAAISRSAWSQFANS